MPSGPIGFADAVALFLDVPAVGIECSGTVSLVVILETLKRLSPGRRHVIVPAYSCPLVVLAIAHCGLETRLCDTVAGGFDLDPSVLGRLCGEETLAVMPTHLGGRVAALDAVIAIARQTGAYVVEDAAQALGARERGRSVGLRGDAGFFSLAAGKGLTLFEGGVWIAADDGLRAEIARTRETVVPKRFFRETQRCLELLGYAAFYGPRGLRLVYGRPLRRALRAGDDIAAAGDYFSPDIPIHPVSAWRQAVGARALARLPAFQRSLEAQAQARLPRLQHLPGLRVLTDGGGGRGNWPLFLLLMPDRARRDAAMARLWGSGLGVSRMFAHALQDYDYLRPWIGAQTAVNARDFADRMLTVSNSPWLDDGRFGRILDVLAEVCS
ncbi:MAG TPA: DegT/DnrJ/EryC1/StrS family aminotransferase [Candidatus Sulfotelmatobacter sp.]|nr:DegT/DnrJ/EryC1/StrS family aminotransferase [Candidatus Sulfotelmatobacter sp.]